MPFPDEVPGRFYSEPMDFHEGEVERIDAGSNGDYNHGLDLPGTNGPVRLTESYGGNGFYQEHFGGIYPGGAATACCWFHASRGHTVGGPGTEWFGVCPGILSTSASNDTGFFQGSNWTTHTDPESGGNDTSSCDVGITGWLMRPWMIYAGYTNQWMSDPTLEAELIANVTPPEGWFVEWEAYHPIFVGYQIAPDETTTGFLGLRTEGVTWLYDPEVGWNFLGVSGGSGIWQTGAPPDGTELVYYDGGLADWMDPPSTWPQPVQDDDRFTCAFVAPEEGDEAAIPLTLACDALYPASGGPPDDNGSGGRENQTLLVRALWRTPRFRYYRETTTVPPRRIFGRSDGTTHGAKRVRGGGNTVQSGNRTRGSIL